MTGIDSTGSPLETVAGITGGEVVDAFELLGNETRITILLALWEAKEPQLPISDAREPTASFSTLRDRVGMRDSGQFNYHLERLVGTYVRRTDAGYQLTETAEQILHAVFAGTLADHASFEGEPVDSDCYYCGEPAVVDYDDGILVKRCTKCPGRFRLTDQEREGVLGTDYRPPAGLVDRDPDEFYRHGRRWTRHRMYAMMEKVCPDCSGAVSATVYVCDDHDDDEGTCSTCGSAYEATAMLVCDVFKFAWYMPAHLPMVTDTAVRRFFLEHGLDIDATYDAGDTNAFWGAIEDVSVTAEDPLEVVATVELEGDRLSVTLDEEATVVNVVEVAGDDRTDETRS